MRCFWLAVTQYVVILVGCDTVYIRAVGALDMCTLCAAAASQPSRHLLLGNISSRPNESALETVFGKFGPLDCVKVFPGKTYALISFKELAPAAEAMQCLDGHSLLSVSGLPSRL